MRLFHVEPILMIRRSSSVVLPGGQPYLEPTLVSSTRTGDHATLWRMAKRKNVPRRHGNRQIVSMLLLRQGGKCFYCGKHAFIEAAANYNRKATLDHKTPLSLGGEPFGDNVVAACTLCNAQKGMLDAPTFLAVINDHAKRKQLIREAQEQIAATPQKARDANRHRINEASRESLIELQIGLREVVREYRQQLHAGVAEQVDAADLKSAA